MTSHDSVSADSRNFDAIPRQIVDALNIEPEWAVTDSPGAGFVAAGLGVWLTLNLPNPEAPSLRIEVRVAHQVPDSERTWRFLDDRNHKALVGRWQHDPAVGVVALVADLTLAGNLPLAYAVEIVAEMTNTAETVVSRAGPQQELHAAKSLTLVEGRRRRSPHPVVNHLPTRVYPAGVSEQVPTNLLPLVQDELLYVLPGWHVEHNALESVAEASDGSLLLVRATRHPHAGWGLMVSLGGEPYGCDESDGVAYAVTLNRNESAWASDSPGLGCWTHFGAGLEYRAFLSAALLNSVDDLFAPVRLVHEVVRAAAARADGTLLDRAAPISVGPVLQRPVWPRDEDAGAIARRDPINDGMETPTALVYLDQLGRPCAITDESFRLWQSHLLPEDLDDRGVTGFIRWYERERLHS